MLEVVEDGETQNKEELEENMEKKSSDGLVLKDLPKHLKYVFLGKERSQSVIIAIDLTLEEEKEVVETLKQYKEAIAWIVGDLKGINPLICMHKILMEENAKTSIEHQRRLNPMMKEVFKKETLKWLNAVFVYAISDCSTPFSTRPNWQIRTESGLLAEFIYKNIYKNKITV